MAAIRASRRQHGSVLCGQPESPAEQEAPWHGRLPAASRRSTGIRVPDASATGVRIWSASRADGSFVYDPWLRDHLHALVDRALLPDLLAALPGCLRRAIRSTPPSTNELPGWGGCSSPSSRSETKRSSRCPIINDWGRVSRRTLRASGVGPTAPSSVGFGPIIRRLRGDGAAPESRVARRAAGDVG